MIYIPAYPWPMPPKSYYVIAQLAIGGSIRFNLDALNIRDAAARVTAMFDRFTIRSYL